MRPRRSATSLAQAIDRVLTATPAREPSADARAYVAALRERVDSAEPPLLTARVERGLKRADVVRALVERLGLAPATEARVSLRYHELETGQLDADRVRQPVWEALAALLGNAAVALTRSWQPPQRPGAALFHRAADVQTMPAAAAPPTTGTVGRGRGRRALRHRQ